MTRPCIPPPPRSWDDETPTLRHPPLPGQHAQDRERETHAESDDTRPTVRLWLVAERHESTERTCGETLNTSTTTYYCGLAYGHEGPHRNDFRAWADSEDK